MRSIRLLPDLSASRTGFIPKIGCTNSGRPRSGGIDTMRPFLLFFDAIDEGFECRCARQLLTERENFDYMPKRSILVEIETDY